MDNYWSRHKKAASQGRFGNREKRTTGETARHTYPPRQSTDPVDRYRTRRDFFRRPFRR